MDTIVDRIRTLCQKYETSITKLEQELGYANGTIGKWRHAKRRPPLEKVIAIANRLNTTSEYLLNGGQKEKPVPDEEDELIERIVSVATVSRIKTWCHARMILISQLEEFMELEKGYFDSLENGTVPQDVAVRAASFLQVPVSHLYEDRRVKEKYSISADDLEIIAAFHALPENQQEAFRILLGLK